VPSLRASIARHLLAKRHVGAGPASAAPLLVAKRRAPHFNPYLAFWAWSSRRLEWGGPCAASSGGRASHHVLPALMHHFGCVCPSYEALEMVRQVAGGRRVCDVGSGAGYWTYMLRRQGVADVVAVDSGQSRFRVSWIPDTVVAEGAAWLRGCGGAVGHVLLLVYPVVGGDFTRAMLREYRGRDLVVAGTQNRNGYTGFGDMTMDEFVQREMSGQGWRRVLQVPLPSFAGKDEALFVFHRDV